MIDRTHALSVSQQARLVGIARSSAYYRPRPMIEVNQILMRRIDELTIDSVCRGADAGATAASRGARDRPPSRAHAR